jgi:hypothetical protein
MAGVLLLAGFALWLAHARAWGLDRGAPIFGYDAAEYALAARELAENGRFATRYALPVELAAHPHPPWPLALVQPGLVVAEAMLFTLLPGTPEWVVLVLPVLSYLGIGLILAFATRRLFELHAPQAPPALRTAAGIVLGLSFLLDPEAQHFAVGGFTELPFTLGLIAAVAAIALELAPRRPLAFGLLLGLTGAFRGNMLWLSPVLALAAAANGPVERRLRTFALIMAGYGLPLLAWWIYKWTSFGSPAWDLSWLALWDGVGGRTWFSLNHLPELPPVPQGAQAITAIARKILDNIPELVLRLSTGARPLWLGAALIAVFAWRRPRPLSAAAAAVLAILLIGVIVAAATVPILRYVFPGRIAGETVGILSLWALVARAPASMLGPVTRRGLIVVIGALALTWGAWLTVKGWDEARSGARTRGIPSAAAMTEIADRLERELDPDDGVMSNLGPILAWYTRRPVVHLALTPADVDACRHEYDTPAVLLVFRDVARIWSGWDHVFGRPEEATRNRELNFTHVLRFQTRDGFTVVLLECGPLVPRLARASHPDRAVRGFTSSRFRDQSPHHRQAPREDSPVEGDAGDVDSRRHVLAARGDPRPAERPASGRIAARSLAPHLAALEVVHHELDPRGAWQLEIEPALPMARVRECRGERDPAGEAVADGSR